MREEFNASETGSHVKVGGRQLLILANYKVIISVTESQIKISSS
jgi:hypothetical protein